MGLSREYLQQSEGVRYLTTPEEIAQATEIEAKAFNGNGEDIYTLAMIAKVGWLIGYPKNPNAPIEGVLELVPSKDGESLFIHGVAVDPEKKYNGAGVKLIADAITVAKKEGRTKLSATIAPTNGPSINAFLNKHGFKATHFYPNFYGEGEHRLWVEKDLTADEYLFDEDNWEAFYSTQKYENQHLLVADTHYAILENLINKEHYQVVGLVRPEKSGHIHSTQNLLYLVQLQEEV